MSLWPTIGRGGRFCGQFRLNRRRLFLHWHSLLGKRFYYRFNRGGSSFRFRLHFPCGYLKNNERATVVHHVVPLAEHIQFLPPLIFANGLESFPFGTTSGRCTLE